jgi:arylsulfatase A-like enzyme
MPVRHLVLFAGTLLLLSVTSLGRDRQPNVIFIFVDDLGYADLGCTGNDDVATPHIDSLARDGIRLTQFYVASPICSPSRVAVTTGQFPARHRINSFLASRERNREREMVDFLDPGVPTIARAFQGAGYATAHFGKWHMGGGRDVDDAPPPSAYGFDEHLVNSEGMGSRLDRKNTEKHLWTEYYVDRTLDFISRNRDRPFYVHLWPNDVHDAFRPKQLLLEKYAPFSDTPFVQQYYAVIDELDRQVGRVLELLRELGLEKKTLIVLTSDNGPTAWKKYYRRGGIAPGSTGGLRGRKWSLYEGGIRVPFLARWPGVIPAGMTNDAAVTSAVDLFPTFCALAGIRAPTVTFDGLDLSEVLRGASLVRRKPLFWEYGRFGHYLKPGHPNDVSPNLSIRDGDWKLLMNFDGSEVQLYDLANDRAETTNCIARHPRVAARLTRRLLSWRKSLP